MKNLRIFKRIKSLTAYFLIPTSLVGTMTLTGFTNVRAATDTEEVMKQADSHITSCVEVVETPNFDLEEVDSPVITHSAEIIDAPVMTGSARIIDAPMMIPSVEVIEPANSGVYEDKMEVEQNEDTFDVLTSVKKMRKIAGSYASVYITVEQGTMLMTITGKENGQIQDNEFYQIFDEILYHNSDITNFFVILNNYQNQIDFTKCHLPENANVTLSIGDSKEAHLEGLMENMDSLSIKNSTIYDLPSVSEYLNANGGYLSLQGNEQYQSLDRAIQKITQNQEVTFERVHLFWKESDQAVSLPHLKDLKADTIFMTFDGQNSIASSITFNDYTDYIVIYDMPQNVEVCAKNNTNISLNYMDSLDSRILNCPTIRSLQNANMNVYFQYGPENTQDANIQIKMNDKKVTMQSEYEEWTIDSTKNESGIWEFAINYLDEIEQVQSLGQ